MDNERNDLKVSGGTKFASYGDAYANYASESLERETQLSKLIADHVPDDVSFDGIHDPEDMVPEEAMKLVGHDSCPNGWLIFIVCFVYFMCILF